MQTHSVQKNMQKQFDKWDRIRQKGKVAAPVQAKNYKRVNKKNQKMYIERLVIRENK